MESLRRIIVTTLLGGLLGLGGGCTGLQRHYLFYPSHATEARGLQAWKTESDSTIGYSRQVQSPENIWLMLHGNAGQAADRIYALSAFSPRDSIFILEYPGYGDRPGKPSRKSFNAAAIDAYARLRRTFPNKPICVVGESIGSGPACVLAQQPAPPEKIVLLVPFDRLASVAAEHVRWLPVGLLLEAKWNNVRALANYRGPVEIFAAKDDAVIPISHAEKLAESVPTAHFHEIPGGHNDWSRGGRVEIRNPSRHE